MQWYKCIWKNNERDGESNSLSTWDYWSAASNLSKKSGDVLISDWREPDWCVKMQDESTNNSDQESVFENLHAMLSDSNDNEDMNSETSDEIRYEHMREWNKDKEKNQSSHLRKQDQCDADDNAHDIDNTTQAMLDRLHNSIEKKNSEIWELKNENRCALLEHKGLQSRLNENNSAIVQEHWVDNEKHEGKEINKDKNEQCESEIRRLEEEIDRQTDAYQELQCKYEDKEAHTDFIEDELGNTFKKIGSERNRLGLQRISSMCCAIVRIVKNVMAAWKK